MTELKNTLSEDTKEVRSRLTTYIGGALGLVAGLAWNEAITAFIDTLFPIAKDSLLVKFAYAFLLTVLVVIAVQQLDKILNSQK